MASHTTTFRFLKSSWGIWAEMTCEDVILSDFNSDDRLFEISKQIYLSTTSRKMPEAGLKFLCNAIYHNKVTIETIVPKITVLHVTNMELALCDYQDEGLYCVMIQWLNERYGLQIPQPDIVYNKVKNKYIFSIDNLVDLPVINKNK